MDAKEGLPAPWWRGSVGYEVYIRSFSDSTGNGVGDLNGIVERLDHLVALGVDLVWVTPFYPSPMADFGYDVADYCAVDPLFGSIKDFERLAVEVHGRGLRLVVDIVPNHCSNEHRWFQQAVLDPAGQYRDYFIWRDPGPEGGPPNNWISYFGGPAWTLEPVSGQYYLHLFLPEQPDLNWRNPDVWNDFDDILQFWLDCGVDGFRIDVAHALVKDDRLRDNPQIGPYDPAASRWEQWDAFEHLYDVDQPGTADIYRRWRALVAPRGGVLIGETYVLEPSTLADMLPGDGLDLGFWFKPMFIEWGADAIRDVLRGPLEAVDRADMISWVAASHDEVRPPSRFGGGDLGRARALAFSTLLFCLPGVPFLYQGEELGLVDGVVPEHLRADPVGAQGGQSRDGCRTPMPWEPGRAFGFSASAQTWLPHGGRADVETTSAQFADPESWFHRYRRLVELRTLEPDLIDAEVEWLDGPGAELVRLRRGSLTIVVNAGADSAEVGKAGQLVYSTTGRAGRISTSTRLDPAEAIVMRCEAE